MTPKRIAGLCLCIVVTSAAAEAQQGGHAPDTPSASATRVIEVTYPTPGFLPYRRVERRTESGGRKILIETAETVDVDGRFEPVEEVVTTDTQRDVFQFDLQRRRKLAATTQSEVTRTNASTRTVQRTWVADLDGHLTLSSGYVDETRSSSPGIQQKQATLSLQSPEGTLREAERVDSAEQQVSSTVARFDSIHLLRDISGRWLPVGTRSGETRGIGSTARVEEQTVQRPNLTGALVVADKVVSRTVESNGENRTVIETYGQNAEGFVRLDNHLALQQRVTRSTTVTPDGGGTSVEEVEARNFLSPNDPIRVTRRTVETIRRVAPGRWVTDRQIFERDPNGRLVLVAEDTQETTDK